MAKTEKVAVVERAQVGDVLLVCTGPGVLVDKDLQLILVSASESSVAKVLGLDAGPTEITSVQRRKIADVANERGLAVVAVTNERITRGIVTAVSWLGANIKAYSWDDLPRAVEKMAGSSDIQRKIVEAALAMKTKCT